MKQERFVSEFIYTCREGFRYWLMRKPEINRRNGNAFFSINEHIYKSLFSKGPITVLVFDGNKLYGIWEISKDSRVIGPKPFKPGKPFMMYWYSSQDLKIITPEELKERKENILEFLHLDTSTIKTECVRRFW